jgi:hypothetical protein
MTDGGESWFRTCAACGAPLSTEVVHPVYTATGPGDEVSLYSFCDDDCLARWRDGRGPDGTDRSAGTG